MERLMMFEERLKIFEGFSGSGIFSKIAKKRGHYAVTLDIEREADLNMSIMDFDYRQFDPCDFDVMIFAIPCTCFSMASLSHHIIKINETFYPKTDFAFENFRFILKVWEIIMYLRPKYWFIENPKAIMQKLEFMPIPKEVWYCQYGESVAKPTNIFTNMDITFKRCYNNNPMCDHQRAPRGSKTGTQGRKNAFERGKFPEELCSFIIKECEKRLSK